MPVCIAGMHRSGTSMVTKLLFEAGLYLGEEADLIPPGPANPEGFWENRRFVRVNANILSRLHGGWDYPPAIPATWSDGALASLHSDAERVIADFAGREPWGWKDPRNSLTLPFWQSLMPGVRVLIVIRNPLEVAESLRSRNGFSFPLALSLWSAYYQRVCAAAAPRDRLVTHYDVFFQNPRDELRRILEFLEIPVDEASIETACAALVTELRHHRKTARHLQRSGIPAETVALYGALCAEAQWQEPKPERRVARGTDAAEEELRVDPALSDPTSLDFPGRPDRSPGRHGQVRLKQQLAESRARVAELERIVSEQQRLLGERALLLPNQPAADRQSPRGEGGNV
jgi:hypothetical protein